MGQLDGLALLTEWLELGYTIDMEPVDSYRLMEGRYIITGYRLSADHSEKDNHVTVVAPSLAEAFVKMAVAITGLEEGLARG